MLKVFVPKPIAAVRVLPFLPGGSDLGNRLFQSIPESAYEGIFETVHDIAVCDVYLIPHEYGLVKQFPAVLAQWLADARAAKKTILISAYQDTTQRPAIDDAFLLRPSAFRSELGLRDIIMPAYIEDIGVGRNLALVKGEKSKVSFVGKAGFASSKERLRYMLKNYVLLHDPSREGMYVRRKALRILAKDSRIDLRAVVRKQFSAHAKTIELPQEVARREYIDTMIRADFNLAPRGDGNYSLRFFETLALGRIPIFIDTDAPLPLENEIPYDDFIVRVPWDELETMADRVVAFFESKTAQELAALSEKARHVFEQHLFMPSFLKTILTKERFNL